MPKAIDDFCQFISASPTAFHAADQIGNRLALLGFDPLEGSKKWPLKNGGRYFWEKGGSLIAFTLPKKKAERAHIVASHLDSPALKVKPQGLTTKDTLAFLSTEIYGGPILETYLNRPLTLAGKVMGMTQSGKLESRLIALDESPFILPAMPPHLKAKETPKKQRQCQALVHVTDKDLTWDELLNTAHYFTEIVSFDLFLTPTAAPTYLGPHAELLAAPRLDNLSSAYGAIAGLTNSEPLDDVIQIAYFSNHEEIGSRTSQGAASPHLMHTLERIALAQNISREELLCLIEKSICLSLDVAHGYHPFFGEHFDPEHKCLLGKGVVIKEHAGKRYHTDSVMTAHLKMWGKHLQRFASNSDSPCGGTIGPIIASELGIATADLGCPVLSMHAAMEIMAPRDLLDLCHLVKSFLNDESTCPL